jgi:hypothetical protein
MAAVIRCRKCFVENESRHGTKFLRFQRKTLDRKTQLRYFAVTSEACLPDGGSFTEREILDLGHDEDKSQLNNTKRLVGLVSSFARP